MWVVSIIIVLLNLVIEEHKLIKPFIISKME